MNVIKKFKQIAYPDAELPSDEVNIINPLKVITLGIHALPGTVFSIGGENNQFVIGPTGNICLDFTENPIAELYLKSYIEHNDTLMYPIIIDIEYLGVQENE